MRGFHVGALSLLFGLAALSAEAQGITTTTVIQQTASAQRIGAAARLGSSSGRDPVWNGLAIGAIAGGLGFYLVMNSVDEGNTKSEYFLAGLLIGAGAGGGIDALLDRGRSGYSHPKPPRRLRISPAITRHHKGVIAHVGF